MYYKYLSIGWLQQILKNVKKVERSFHKIMTYLQKQVKVDVNRHWNVAMKDS